MDPDWRRLLDSWRAAGLIDDETSGRISAWETREAPSARWEWPVVLALILGGIALGAGLLLFVAANWDPLPAGTRFVVVIFFIAIFHIVGLVGARDSPSFRSALHAIGTFALGPGIALTWEIFHLKPDWPAEMRSWVFGAAIAWALLRDTAQFSLAATLIPIWLGIEFIALLPHAWSQLWATALLLSIVYLGAVSGAIHSRQRLALVWIGAIGLLPFTIAASVHGQWRPSEWILLVPLCLALFLRRREAWIPALFALWIVALQTLSAQHSFLVHLWCAIGSIGLIAWGWREDRKERINLGIAGFALNILLFYVSNVLDKLGRSASLVALGILLLAGGWVLERIRRRLVHSGHFHQ